MLFNFLNSLFSRRISLADDLFGSGETNKNIYYENRSKIIY
jgi:hypothetical protein